jgi:sterol desaturase/sphingolipid hydroxylase (fatty acid hydroxylase superfamily)
VEPRQESTPQQPVKARMTRGEVVEAPIQPLDVTGLRTVGVGTTAFAGATFYLLLFQLDWMRDTDRLWWLWTCFAGLGLGVFGFVYCTRRARHHDLDDLDSPPPRSQED